jgi:hypothetical protein
MRRIRPEVRGHSIAEVSAKLDKLFVSIMSERGASVELIADLVGHKDLATSWTVYRHQLRPVITEGADMMNQALREHGTGPQGTSGPSKQGFLSGSPPAADKGIKPHRA